MSVDFAAVATGTRCELCAMPWSEYLRYPALNPSTIVHGRRSMRHLRHAWEHGGDDNDAMLYGRALHTLLFEPREFEHRYRPWDGRRAGNAYTDFLLEAAVAGAEVMKAEGLYSFASAIEAAQGFLRHALVQHIVSAGQWEQSVFVVESGLQCKGRIDGISTAEHCIVDLKTSNDITHRAFGRTFARLGYHLKLSLYQRWLNRITGDTWPVTVICLESRPPYDVVVVPVHDAVLDTGVAESLPIIANVAQCIQSGEWPGIASSPYPLDFPEYAMDEIVEFQE